MGGPAWAVFGNPTTHASAQLMQLGMDSDEAEACVGRPVLYQS